MKIALFHTTLPEPGRKLGGVEVAVHRLANQLAQDPRDEVTVVSATPAPHDARYKHEHVFANWPWLGPQHGCAIGLFALHVELGRVAQV